MSSNPPPHDAQLHRRARLAELREIAYPTDQQLALIELLEETIRQVDALPGQGAKSEIITLLEERNTVDIARWFKSERPLTEQKEAKTVATPSRSSEMAQRWLRASGQQLPAARPPRGRATEVQLREELEVRDEIDQAGLEFSSARLKRIFVRSLAGLTDREREVLIQERRFSRLGR